MTKAEPVRMVAFQLIRFMGSVGWYSRIPENSKGSGNRWFCTSCEPEIAVVMIESLLESTCAG